MLRIVPKDTVTQQVHNRLRIPVRQFTKPLSEAIGRIADHIVERSAALAPIDVGTLRKSIHADYDNMRDLAPVTVVSVKSELPYAFKMHESVYVPSPKSLSHGPQPEGQIGQKFIARAVQYNWKFHSEILAQGMEATITSIFGEPDKNSGADRIEAPTQRAHEGSV